MKKYSILGVRVSYSSYDYFVERVVSSAKRNRSLKVAPVASHPVKKSFFDKKLKIALTGFDLVLPDGQSLVWAANKLYNADIKERIYGPELFNRIALRCEKEKIKVLLYGNHTGKLVKKLKLRHKKLQVVNILNLEGRPVTKMDSIELAKTLGKYRRSVLFMGIGSPAQHYLMASLKGIKLPVVAVGAAFDFLAGVKKQAPNWIQNIGLEWLFRFLSEPGRLWKRYLIDAPIFVLLIVIQRIIMTGSE